MATDIDIFMDIQAKSVDMDMDGKFHIHGNPADFNEDTTNESASVDCSNIRL